MRFCRFCGCSDERGCPEGCYWMENPWGIDVCSMCTALAVEIGHKIIEGNYQAAKIRSAMPPLEELVERAMPLGLDLLELIASSDQGGLINRWVGAARPIAPSPVLVDPAGRPLR